MRNPCKESSEASDSGDLDTVCRAAVRRIATSGIQGVLQGALHVLVFEPDALIGLQIRLIEPAHSALLNAPQEPVATGAPTQAPNLDV